MLGDQGHFTEAYKIFDDALNLAKKSGIEVEGSILALNAAVKIWQGEWQSAMELAGNVKDKAQQINSSYVYTMGCSIYAYAEWKLYKRESSLHRITQLTHWLESQGNYHCISLNYSWLTEAKVEIQEYTSARHYAALCLQRSRKGDSLGKALTYRALASAASNQQQHTRSHRYCELAMKSSKTRNSKHEEASTHAHIALIHFQQNQIDHATSSLDKARLLRDKLGINWQTEQTKDIAPASLQ